MSQLLITNVRVTPDPADDGATILHDHAIAIEGDTIVAIGPTAEIVARYADAERLDGTNKLALPGAICAHTHFYGAFARGMAIPGPAPRDFPEILERLWWKLDRSLTLDDVRSSALVILVDAVRHGCTTIIDHHASPNAITDSLDAIGEAVGPKALLARQRLALAVDHLADALHAAQKAVLEVDEALAAELLAAQLWRRRPLRMIGPVDDVGAEHPQGPSRRGPRRRRC